VARDGRPAGASDGSAARLNRPSPGRCVRDRPRVEQPVERRSAANDALASAGACRFAAGDAHIELRERWSWRSSVFWRTPKKRRKRCSRCPDRESCLRGAARRSALSAGVASLGFVQGRPSPARKAWEESSERHSTAYRRAGHPLRPASARCRSALPRPDAGGRGDARCEPATRRQHVGRQERPKRASRPRRPVGDAREFEADRAEGSPCARDLRRARTARNRRGVVRRCEAGRSRF